VLGSCSEGEEFGVAEGVLVAIAAVLGLGDRLALGVEEDRADGDVTGLGGLVGLGEGLVHPVVVVIHGAIGCLRWGVLDGSFYNRRAGRSEFLVEGLVVGQW
jgi:hypothetical protein